ncbi:MAG: SDR family oxidoreductase [Pseudomonadota bacterium]
MNFVGLRVLLTGASGGIGTALLMQLVAAGASVAVPTRRAQELRDRVAKWGIDADRVYVLGGDLADSTFRNRLPTAMLTWKGGLDVLINNAGISDFGLLASQSGEDIAGALATNLLAPMDLCRLLLPLLQDSPAGRIVNVGSVYGAIGYPGQAIYSASKFGLRGFSEALRRELADTHIGVVYVAPRATRTRLNSPAVDQLNEALGNAVDDPGLVAAQILRRLADGVHSSVLGWPEKLFVRINALLPGVVDAAIRSKLAVIKSQAAGARAAPRKTPLRSVS